MKNTRISKRRKAYRRKIIKQRLMGIGALLLCVFIVVFALQGQTPGDSDVTPVLLIAPMGFGLLFSKECWLYRS